MPPLHALPLDSLGPLIASAGRCLFFDAARPSLEQRYSLLFVKPIRVHACHSLKAMPRFFETISEEAKQHWIAGYLTYEAAYGLEERLSRPVRATASRACDLAWFGVFGEPLVFDHYTGRWNRPHPLPAAYSAVRPAPRTAAPPTLRALIGEAEYGRTIRRIRNLIAAGDVYQVNFTYDVDAALQPRAWELYRSLRERQPVPFGSLIKTRTSTIVSLSPELLFIKQGARIRVRPMKGTAPRGRFTLEDTRIAAALAADAKNRSENIMIVDLLRNDLGKICSIGSVTTKNLFAVERHPTLHQMTSTVEGNLRRGVGLSEIFRALFPSGSVTGAPKLRAMEVLRELEQGTRGVYCGAIGYSSPSGRAVFSVPIRTLHKKPGARSWRYRVGSGIVWDSRAGAEWAECGDKCSFLTSVSDDFRLFESILFSKGVFLYLRDHRLRLFDSARYFEFPASLAQWGKTAGEIVAALGGSPGEHKVRVFLDKSGRYSWDHAPLISALRQTQCTAPLNASPAEAAPTKRPVFLSRKPVDPASPFLFHKTTIRPWYSRDMELIARGTCFDVLHTNTEGAITEGARSNVFVQINGALHTPPLECGLLPGVLRGRLLRSGKCSERILTPRDLKKAQAVFCGNSVRGLVEVRFAGTL